DDLFDVDRLGQIILDAELEAADLVLDRGLAREEYERDISPVCRRSYFLAELEAVDVVRKLGLADDQVGRVQLELVERILDGHRRRDGKPRLAQGHLEHSQ